MANLFDAISSVFKKKKDEELVAQMAKPVPVAAPAPVMNPNIKPIDIGGAINSAVSNVSNAWNNYWKPTPEVRTRDIVRELPQATVDVGKAIGNFGLNAARSTLTRLPAQAVMSVADDINSKLPPQIQNKYPTTIQAKDPLGRVLFGDEPLKSYQQQARDNSKFGQEKLGLSKGVSDFGGAGIALSGAMLDAPGLGGAKAVAKEGAEKLVKEGVEKQVIKTADELAPLLQELAPEAKATLGDAVAALKEKGVQLTTTLVKKLKSGKVIDGDGYVIQTIAKDGDRLVANFDKNLIKPVVESVPVKTKGIQLSKKVLQPTVKEATAVAPEVVEPVIKNTVKEVIPNEIKPTAETVADIAARSVDETDKVAADAAKSAVDRGGAGVEPAVDTATEYLATRPTYQKLGDASRDTLRQAIKDTGIAEDVAKIKGAPITEEEVANEALRTQEYVQNVITRDKTLADEQQIVGLQNRLSLLFDQMEKAKGTDDYPAAMEAWKQAEIVQRSVAAHWGNLGHALQAAGDAEQPTGVSILKKVFAKTEATTAQMNEILKKWENVDKNSVDAMREFYYTFVTPSAKEITDEYRYINLLSSPLTQVRNFRGNALATLIEEPVTQVFRGLVDRVKTMVGLQETRQTFSREAGEMITGYTKAVPAANQRFMNVLNHIGTGGTPDLPRLPVGKFATKADIFTTTGKAGEVAGKVTGAFLEKFGKVNDLMQATDAWFKEVIAGGVTTAKTATAKRLGKEVTGEVATDIAKQAKAKGIELTLQTPLDPTNATNQGMLSSMLDTLTQALSEARSADKGVGQQVGGRIVGLLLPFLQVATNSLKRVASYTPGLGLLDIPGADAARLTEIAARQATGAFVLASAYTAIAKLDLDGRISYSVPKDTKGKEQAYAAAPEWAIRVGGDKDKGGIWVSVNQLGVFGKIVKLAMMMKQQEVGTSDLTKNGGEQMMDAFSQYIVGMADDSFVKSIGLAYDALKGSKYAMRQLASQPVAQSVPLASFVTWFTKVLDNTNRKSESQDPLLNAIAPVGKNLPGLSMLYDPYLKPDGSPSTFSRLNSLSPDKLQWADPDEMQAYKFMLYQRQLNNLQRSFSDGEIDAETMTNGMQKADEILLQKLPQEKTKLPQGANFKLPTKDEIRQMTAPTGVKFGAVQKGVTGGGGVSISKSGKVTATAPKLSMKGISFKMPKLSSAPKTAAKLNLPKLASIKGINLKTPQKKKTGASIQSEVAARKRSKRDQAVA